MAQEQRWTSESLEPFRHGKTIRLTTHRRDGSAAQTPVNIAFVGDRAFFRTWDTSWKAKRIRRNPDALAILKAHADLFEIEDHGANHVPAILGVDRRIYGLAGVADLKQLRLEVSGGADAVKAATGIAPQWYRGATGEYDPEALKAIEKMGYKVAGFSVNADNGATLSQKGIIARLKKVQGGDIIIAHLNKPASDTGKGMAQGLQLLVDQGFSFVRLDASDVRTPHKRI